MVASQMAAERPGVPGTPAAPGRPGRPLRPKNRKIKRFFIRNLEGKYGKNVIFMGI
jgi:hypothetical protein